MSPENIIETSWITIQKIWQSERTLFVWIMICVLLFVWFVIREWNIGQKEARNAFLQSMEKRDDKMEMSLDKMTNALSRNTEIMIKLDSKIK